MRRKLTTVAIMIDGLNRDIFLDIPRVSNRRALTVILKTCEWLGHYCTGEQLSNCSPRKDGNACVVETTR